MKPLLSTTLLVIVLLHQPVLSQTEVQKDSTSVSNLALASASDSKTTSSNVAVFSSASAPASELANESLELLQAKKDLPQSLIFIEQSLFKNPYNLKAYELRSKIYDNLNYTSDRIPFTAYIFAALPIWLSLLAFTLCFFWCAKNWGKWHNLNKKFSTVSEALKIKSYFSLFLSLSLFIFFFTHLNQNKKSWACIVSSQAPLKTGPSVKANTQRKLNAGVCFSPISKKGAWTSLTASDLVGWVETKSLRTVR